MILSKTEAWKSQRKITNPAFRRSMPTKVFAKCIQDMFEVMDRMGETIDVSNLMRRYTLDVIGKAGFGNNLSIFKSSFINKKIKDLNSMPSAIRIVYGLKLTKVLVKPLRILCSLYFPY